MNEHIADVSFQSPFNVPENASCTTGHFPGNPIVPGAWLLALLDVELRKNCPHFRITKLKKVKFIAALKPTEKAVLSVNCLNNVSLTFSIHRGDTTLVQGSALISNDTACTHQVI